MDIKQGKRVPLTASTTRVVEDRFAKIASAYTKGFVKVRYIGNRICTDQVEVITMPQSIENCGEDLIAKAWGYLNHEMGHIEVQRALTIAKATPGNGPGAHRAKFARCSEALYEAIPVKVRKCGVEPGTLLRTPVEMLLDLRRYGRDFADAYEMNAHVAVTMIKDLVNVTEDPRMEEQVSKRWAGAAENLALGTEFAHATWKEKSAKLLEEGTDGSFFQFGCGVIFYLQGVDPAFMGPRVEHMIEATQDILDLYLEEWNIEDAHGFYDAWNCAIALLARCYEVLGGLTPPKADEPSLGDFEEADESEEGEEDEAGEPSPADDDEEGEVAESDGEAEEGEAGDDDGDESDDGASEDGADSESDSEGDDGGDSDESGDDGEDSEGEGDGSKGARGALEVGQKIRIKSTGKVAHVTKVYPDGSIEAA